MVARGYNKHGTIPFIHACKDTKIGPKHSNPGYKTVFRGKEAYHIPETSSNGFPWLNPAFVPHEIINLNVVSDRDFDIKIDEED